MTKKILPVLSILLLIYLGRTFMDEYLLMHPYYAKMIQNRTSLKIVFVGLIFALLPTAYIVFSKKKNIRALLGTIVGSASLFSLTYVATKSDLHGGGLSLVLHHVFLFGLAFFFFIGLENLGEYIKERFLHLRTVRIGDILLNLGIGLAVFLLLIYVLVLTNLLYSLVSWLFLVGLGVLLWWRKGASRDKWTIIDETFSFVTPSFHHVWYLPFALPFLGYVIAALVHGQMSFLGWIAAGIGALLVGSYIMHGTKRNDWGFDRLFSVEGLATFLLICLLVLTFWYVFNGFQLAYLPYPTAWDANHVYMFFPKMWALNNGYYWTEASISTSMTLWPMYITYFFSLFNNFGSFLGISPDTIAIEMNFWSGLLVLVFGLGLVAELQQFLRGEKMASVFGKLTFLLGWFLLLQWLLSGMGAFLVFIDNKTDMGVLALIIMAAYSGFMFLNRMQSAALDEKKTLVSKQIWIYVCLSGVFYAIAVLAKPTALFDVVNFGLFLWMVRFGWVGVLGLTLLIMGGMTHIDFRGIKEYIPQHIGWILMSIGAVGVGIDSVRLALKKAWVYVRYLLGWTACVIGMLVIVKTPFMVADAIFYDKSYTVGEYIERILLSSTKETATDPSSTFPLLAQAGNMPVGDTCTLVSQGFSTTEELYATTQNAPGNAYNEDVGRYVGFGWKGNLTTDARRKITPLLNPWWAKRFGPGCYSFNIFDRHAGSNAKLLCGAEQSLEELDLQGLQQVVGQLSTHTMIGDRSVQERVQDLIDALVGSSPDVVRAEYGPDINDLRSFMQNNTMKIEDHEGVRMVYFPYKYLTPSNITFNWSLQNLSSYYTDIGIVRLILFVFAFVGLLYGCIIGQRKLVAISLVTIFGWILRWMIGGAILWYAIGIIVWSILAFVAYLWYLLTDEDTNMLGLLFVLVFLIVGGYQMTLNMVRIASQGGGGAFLWYKTNHGISQVYNEQLQPTTTIDTSFTAEDVFAMQFPHYRKFLSLANTRTDDEGALIAGTYARYFVEKQHHIKYDQFLTWLRKMFSDGNECNSYLRLQDNHIKYLVIDPNIGTVVQGAGNQSLFDRFFARVDASGNNIVEHGTMTMLVEMYRAGHVRYVSSNNLGAKYAFILPDSTFSGLEGDALTLARSRMALSRFFNSSGISSSIVQVAKQRVQDGMFMDDIADLLGVEIRINLLLDLVKKGQLLPTDVAELTNDERKVFGQYLGLRQMATTQPEQYNQQLQGLVRNSVSGGNQIIVLEVVDY